MDQNLEILNPEQCHSKLIPRLQIWGKSWNGNFNANMSNMGVYTFEGNDWQQNYLNYDQSTNTSNAPQVYDISLRSGTLAYLRLRQPSQIYWQLNIHFVE